MALIQLTYEGLRVYNFTICLMYSESTTKNSVQISISSFDEVCSYVKEGIQKQNTRFNNAVVVEERLAVTLRDVLWHELGAVKNPRECHKTSLYTLIT
ncbi:hypothetical protein ABEB36_013618 [Hypothenemus hampei]|uniref:Uncharacterized protein n=1 Tax=Hypothenemus hampei TaxID=57062 RepID=A0ABD1E5Q4_HYPHA